MKRPHKSRFEQAGSEIDLRLGDLLGQIGEALSEAAERLESGDSGEIRRERDFDTGSGPIRASAGIRISTPGGQARKSGATGGQAGSQTGGRRPDQPVNTPGATPTEPPSRAPRKVKVPALRRVETTIFEEPNHWSLVADMPGITRADVTLTAGDGILRVEAVTTARHYILETAQPVGWTRFDYTVHNGILEVQAAPTEESP